jgi:hypothetical protein
MTAKRARIERGVWDSGSGRFAPTGEAVEGDASALEQLANNLSGSPELFLKGPVPWPWIITAAALSRAALNRRLVPVAAGRCLEEPNGNAGQR